MSSNKKKPRTVAEEIMNEPPAKIYFIRNEEGKFYNSKDGVWYSEMINANYERKSKLEILRDVVKANSGGKFTGCEIFETTNHKLWEEMATWTTDAVLAGSYFQGILHKIANRLPTISAVDKMMYQRISQAIEVLKPLASWNDDFIKSKEDTTDEITGHYAEYITETASVKIHQAPEVTELIKMYKVDPKSMLGVAKTVRKRNENAPTKSY